MRPCLNELQKEYCVKTKVIALNWQWANLRSWCQMNRNGHSSPVKHKVEDKPHKMLEKLKITSGKSTLFGHFLWSIIRSHRLTFIFLHNTNDIKTEMKWYTSHMSDFMFILSSLYWWYWGVLLWFWVVRVKKKKQERQVGFKERLTFLKIWF